MSEQPTVYRNRPTFRGLLVRPRQQMRLAVFFVIACFLVNISLAVTLVVNLEELTPFDVIIIITLFTLLLAVITLVKGLLYSHRVFGPLISIKRHIAALREGQYTARLQLRQTDDLAELKDSLNDLAQSLEARHGPGPKQPS